MAKIVPIGGWPLSNFKPAPAARERKTRKAPAKRGRQHDRAHLALIRRLPCIVSGETRNVVAAHIRFSSDRFKKTNPGNSAKPHDCWTVPLAERLHTEETGAQHRAGEEAWWSAQGINPLRAAQRLYDLSESLRSIGRPDDEILQAMTFVVSKVRAEGAR
ncbi:hypothetical protein ACLBXM_17775 [Xanthobacteraceae bacterium A53D]